MSTFYRGALLAALIASAAGCDLTVDNPNAATPDEALGTRGGLITFANGLARSYAVSTLDNVVLTPGVTAREVAVNRTFANLLELEAGGTGLPTDNADVNALFTALYSVVFDADQLIQAAQTVPTVEDALENELVATGSFYKAAALGALAQNFEQVALNPGAAGGATFSDRNAAFDEAIRLLEVAERLGTPVPVAPGVFRFDLVNTARVYRARFALFRGNYATALAASAAVTDGATSVFPYQDLAPNPLYSAFYIGTPSYAVRDSLGLATIQAGDQRVDFYTDARAATSVNRLPIDIAAGFVDNGRDGVLPAYLPDEIRLIRAEALVRSGGDLNQAVALVNEVRTATADPFGVVAGLPPYAGPVTVAALLDEIYYNRSTELFLQGLRLEDARRFNRPGPSSSPFERSRNFYPYPDQERQGNPNVPANPAL